jgi:hypothetical protein
VTSFCELLDTHDITDAASDLLHEGIDWRRFAAEAITPLTTWPAIRDEASKKRPLPYPRSDLKPARTSSEKICGCSQAAKWPPFSTLL